jgi:tight adherence protein B
MSPFELGFLLLLLAGIGGSVYFWHVAGVRRQCLRQLDAHTFGMATPSGVAVAGQFPRRYRVAAPLAGLIVAAVVAVTSLPKPFAVAAGLMIGVFTWLGESIFASRSTSLMEAQLADSIDLMIGSLRAGAAFLAALEAALREAREPFRSQLRDLIGRIRLGDDPIAAVGDLARRIPLETFRLFSLSLSVHWETGGSMASTLSSVGRTIRDRIEMSRRVQTQGVEAQASVIGVLCISYLMGYIMWRANPDTLMEFLFSPIGSEIVAAVICLQALGIVWISRMSDVKF